MNRFVTLTFLVALADMMAGCSTTSDGWPNYSEEVKQACVKGQQHRVRKLTLMGHVYFSLEADTDEQGQPKKC